MRSNARQGRSFRFALTAALAAHSMGGPIHAEERRDETRPWALAPLARPKVPWSAGGTSAIDAFLNAKIGAAGLAMRPPADRATLLRRVRFDLTGLPPTPEEIDAFVNDPDEHAYEHLVDRLLADPALGERFGRSWLDIARFTESQGFEYDRLRDRAYPYRDFVVAAMNDDMPYDRFMRLQIAGDVTEPVTRDGIVATGFLVCGPWDEAGNGQANATQRAITRQDELEDLLSVVGQGLLGFTVNCARCHDHKFDPIPRLDYYRMQSVFAGVRHGERPLLSDAAISAREKSIAALDLQSKTLEIESSRIASIGVARVRATRKSARSSEGHEHPRSPAPAPYRRWRFDDAPTGSDVTLPFELYGAARIEGGRLVLDGRDAYAATEPIEKDLTEKTLEAFVALSATAQGGGAAISIEAAGGQQFDAIVFGERQAGKWIAGSNGFVRTQDLDADAESAGADEIVQVAIVYRGDGTIAVYRNGAAYGTPWRPGESPVTFLRGDARVLFGLRHHGGANAFLRGAIEEAALYDRALTPDEVRASFDAVEPSSLTVSRAEALAALTVDERSELARIEQSIQGVKLERDAIAPLESGYVGRREQPEPTRELRRGDVTMPGEVVTPGALSCVTTLDSDFHLPPDAKESDRRIAFADWLTSERNPLPARVIVNRIWQWHFGRGLVATPSDFGTNSGTPSHPELLDWLASELVDSGFHLKAIHRLIVLSAAYRQTAASDSVARSIDADDRWLWRFPPRRLDAEMVRDAILAVSGALDRTIGGTSFRPFTVLPFPANAYPPAIEDRDEFHRRSLYRMNVNSGKDTLLDAFDCPDPSIKTPTRSRTTTPLQALVMMNDPFVLRESKRFAARILAEAHGDVESAIVRGFEFAFGRVPRAEELTDAIALVRAHGLDALTWSLFNASEFVDVR